MHAALKDAGLVSRPFNADQAIFDFARLKREKFERNVGLAAYAAGALIVAGILGWIVMLRRNLRARRKIEDALHESEAQLRAIADNSPSAIFLKDTEGHFIFANQVWHKTNNPTGMDIVGKTVHDFLSPEIADEIAAVDARVTAMGVPVVEEQRLPIMGGGWQYVLSTKFPVFDESGDTIAIGAVNTDITDRVMAERALRDSEAHLTHAQRIAKLGSWVWELSTNKVTWSDTLYRLMQINPANDGDPLEDFFACIHPDDRAVMVENNEKMKQPGRQELAAIRIILPDGEERHLHMQSVAEHDATGRPIRVIGITQDVTESKHTEEALRQSQKMEAVGQLTGGVAHDFNNLLAVIIGSAELLVDEVGDNRLLTAIDRAATRGAELTQRLLAFSRQQSLAPQSIDLAELVASMDSLLQRTLGEPVKIVTNVPEDIWPVLADPGQLENALLNLAINARDAMPDSGVLEISCSNIELLEGDDRVSDEVAAGDYVLIAIRDTGSGMTQDVLEHVFEPFYTTKSVGEGTGLGLSMVYGFARQSGGDVVIESEVGTGTEVKIFLPRSAAVAASVEPERSNGSTRGQGEVILILEDDADVSAYISAVLGGLDFRVLAAPDASSALRILEEEGPVDLLLSDVVLPGGVSGPEFAIKAKDIQPQLRVIFMTGYVSDTWVHEKLPETAKTVLNKPFRREELVKAIHNTLAA